MTTKNKTAHTAGPWTVGHSLERNYIYGAGAHLGCISSVSDNRGEDGFEEGHSEAVANAARIVACVNAMEGMNPDAIADVVAALRGIKGLMGNVDHSKGGGENAARLYGGMLMDCKEIAVRALQKLEAQS